MGQSVQFDVAVVVILHVLQDFQTDAKNAERNFE